MENLRVSGKHSSLPANTQTEPRTDQPTNRPSLFSAVSKDDLDATVLEKLDNVDAAMLATYDSLYSNACKGPHAAGDQQPASGAAAWMQTDSDAQLNAMRPMFYPNKFDMSTQTEQTVFPSKVEISTQTEQNGLRGSVWSKLEAMPAVKSVAALTQAAVQGLPHNLFSDDAAQPTDVQQSSADMADHNEECAAVHLRAQLHSEFWVQHPLSIDKT